MAHRRPYKLKYLKTDQLQLWKDVNVRKTDKLIDIEDLANNIREIGVQNPLLVIRDKATDKYLVISGQRRLIAARKAELDEVPCVIREGIKPIDAVIASFSENVYRLDMNDDDKAEAADTLRKQLKSIDLVAKKLGISPTTVRRYLSLKTLPDPIKKLRDEGKITSTVAREIYYKFTDPEEAYEMVLLYVNSSDDEKPDIYAAIKESTSSDTVQSVRKRAKKIGSADRYTILLPRPTSKIIQDLAIMSNQKAQVIIAEIVEEWVDEFNRGKKKWK